MKTTTRRRSLHGLTGAIALACALTSTASAEDTYVTVRVRDVIDRSAIPNAMESMEAQWWPQIMHIDAVLHPYAVLDGSGEVYVVAEPNRDGWNSIHDATVAIRTPLPGNVTGKLFVPNRDLDGFTATAFEVAPRDAPDAREVFLDARLRHYRRLQNANLPGGAWFRHQARKAAQTLGRADEAPPGQPPAPWGQPGEMERTFALVSGGLALSENLQLDRMLAPADRGAMTVDVDTIAGVSVRALDWERLVEGLDPARDPLASAVPADQHVLLFPSFEAMVDLVDRADEIAAPIVPSVELRAENAGVRARYEQQLCMPLNRMARELGPRLIDSVALTGSDPYFRTGTDVALLFTSSDPPALRRALGAFVALAAQERSEEELQRGDVHGVFYVGLRTSDRRICTYLALLGDVVVVTNSTAQLERLARTAAGEEPALASLPEYVFFRDRYRRDDATETALLVLSDHAIRRWCGPRWRIGTSRRTRAAAVMADIQATYLDDLAAGSVERGPVFPAHPLAEGESLTLAPRGIESSAYGTLAFQTPIAEMDLDRVTPEEERLYTVWRDRYQRRWRNAFDPIAVRFSVDGETAGVDVTVMPLIEGTDYAPLMGISQGAAFALDAGDPHDTTVAHALLAVNRNAPLVQMYSGMLSGMTGRMLDPLGWFGGAVALYADDDPVLAEIGLAGGGERFLEDDLHRVPIALHIDARDGMKLTMFLAGLRGFLDQTAPGMTVWENLEHEGEPFVRITPSERARAEQGMEELSIYYAASGEALIVTTREDVLRRAIDRQCTRRAAADGTTASPQASAPWLGENVAVRIDRKAIGLMEALFGEDLRRRMQLRSWRNIPILNEWHRRYPDRDVVALHEQFWHRRPICPGGGAYRWNDEWRTMESTVFGHPGAPSDAGTAAVFDGVRSLDAGLTFEPDGLRARIHLERETK
ncbi:MAG: hypothetical protein GY715_05085 [Planctomycetes bacterium]|nr:hypothetical protein [Planctomycetota bacterium]